MFHRTVLRRSSGDHNWFGNFLSSSMKSKSSSFSGPGSVSSVSALLQQPLPNRSAVLEMAIKNRAILLNSASWSLATPLSLLRLLYLFSNAGVGITGLSRSAGPTVMALLPSLTQKEVLSASVALLRLEGAEALSSVPQEWIDRLQLSLQDCTWVNGLEDVQLLASALALQRRLERVNTAEAGNQPLKVTFNSASARQLELALLRWTDELSPWECIVFLHSLKELPVDQYLIQSSLQRRIRDALREATPPAPALPQPQTQGIGNSSTFKGGKVELGSNKKGSEKDIKAWGEVVSVLRGTVLESETCPSIISSDPPRRGSGAPFRLTLDGFVVILEAYPFSFRRSGSPTAPIVPVNQHHAREIETLRLLKAVVESWIMAGLASCGLEPIVGEDLKSARASKAVALLSRALYHIRSMTKAVCNTHQSTLPLHPELLSVLLSLENGCETLFCKALVELSKTPEGFEELLEPPTLGEDPSSEQSCPILLMQCLGLVKRSPLLILDVIASCGITSVHHIGRLSEASSITLLKIVHSVIVTARLAGQVTDPSAGLKEGKAGSAGAVGPQVVTALLDGLAARLHLSAESDTLSLSQVIVVAKLYGSLMTLVGQSVPSVQGTPTGSGVERTLSESPSWERRLWLENLDLGEGCTILLEKLLSVLHERVVANLNLETWSTAELFGSAHFVRAYLGVAKYRPHILWEPKQRKALLGLHGRCQSFVEQEKRSRRSNSSKHPAAEGSPLLDEAMQGLQRDLFEMGLLANTPSASTKATTTSSGCSRALEPNSLAPVEPELLTKLELSPEKDLKEKEAMGVGPNVVTSTSSTLVTPVKEVHQAPKIRPPTIRMKG